MVHSGEGGDGDRVVATQGWWWWWAAVMVWEWMGEWVVGGGWVWGWTMRLELLAQLRGQEQACPHRALNFLRSLGAKNRHVPIVPFVFCVA